MKRDITILLSLASIAVAQAQETTDSLTYATDATANNDTTEVYEESYPAYERDTFEEDGVTWQYCQQNGVAIYQSCERVRDYGKWHQVRIEIVNDTDEPIEFDPDHMLAWGYHSQNDRHPLVVWNHDDYMQKVRRVNLWTTIAVVAVGVASDIAMENSYATHYDSHRRGHRGDRGHHSRHHHSMHAAAMAHHHAMTAINTVGLGLALANEYEMRDEGYLRKTTIEPGEAITGYVNIQREKDRHMGNSIAIGGDVFAFEW